MVVSGMAGRYQLTSSVHLEERSADDFRLIIMVVTRNCRVLLGLKVINAVIIAV